MSNEFFESQKAARESEGKKYYDKVQYMELTPGQHIIRVLQVPAKKYTTHWIGGSVLCLGEDCPQCEVNRTILAQTGDNFKEAMKVQGFIWGSERGAVNVLDRTPVRVCPKCGKEIKAVNGRMPDTCPGCNNMVRDVEIKPLNVVKIFSRAATVFDQMAQYHKTVLDASGEPLGLTQLDLVLHVVGNTTVPVVGEGRDEVTVAPEQLYDLDNSVIKLSRDEMILRMKGASWKDVYAARRATGGIQAPESNFVQPTVTPVVAQQIKFDIDSMFKK